MRVRVPLSIVTKEVIVVETDDVIRWLNRMAHGEAPIDPIDRKSLAHVGKLIAELIGEGVKLPAAELPAEAKEAFNE